MKSRSPQASPRLSLREITLLALCAALLTGVQVGLAGLPNVELVSLLIMLFTLCFRQKVLFIIYLFALAEGLIFGFDPLWWPAYLYVWTLLAGAAWLCRRFQSPWLYAVLSGVFGLAFGALCAVLYLFHGGPAVMAGKWVSGIPFDLWHGVCNFAITLALWEPLYDLLGRFAGDFAGAGGGRRQNL